ncbi:MAG: flagellar biosynthetic protein FliR [Candidatus Wallbacteria bacterium]|nr:flagellar biosynthetic protein FliR [Candidatus Wallbacteria bacterium]
MSDLDLLAWIVASPTAQTWIVCACRTAGAVAAAAPPLGGVLPSSVRAALILAVAASLVSGRQPALVAGSAPALLAAAIAELMIGLLLALPVRLIVEALRHAGELFAASALPAPSSSCSLLDGGRASVAGHVAAMAAIAAALECGADGAVVAALGRSFQLLAPGSWPTAGAMLAAVEGLGGAYLHVAAAAVLPLMAVVFAADLALAMGARVAGLEAAGDAFGGVRALAMLVILAVAAPMVYSPAALAALTEPTQLSTGLEATR